VYFTTPCLSVIRAMYPFMIHGMAALNASSMSPNSKTCSSPPLFRMSLWATRHPSSSAERVAHRVFGPRLRQNLRLISKPHTDQMSGEVLATEVHLHYLQPGLQRSNVLGRLVLLAVVAFERAEVLAQRHHGRDCPVVPCRRAAAR